MPKIKLIPGKPPKPGSLPLKPRDPAQAFTWHKGELRIHLPKGKDFAEELHPRDAAGRFASGGGDFVGEREYRRFESAVEADAFGVRASGAAYASMNDEEINSMDRYKGAAFININRSLRDPETFAAKYGDDAQYMERMADDVYHLDQVIARSPLPEAVVTYRGVSAAHLPEGNLVGGVFSDAAFSSTSMNERLARGWGSALIEYRLPAGHNGFCMSAMLQGHDVEAEILLGRGGEYRVLEDRMDVNNNQSQRHLVVEPVQ